MRLGLVAVGVVFAVVGAAVIVAIVAPGDDPTFTHTATSSVVDLPATDSRTVEVAAVAADRSTDSFVWASSSDASVELFATKPCSLPPGICEITPALDEWAVTSGGHWSASGRAVAVYEIWVQASAGGSATLNFSSTFSEQYRVSQLSLPTLAFGVALGGGALLAGLGGVVLYLGLFLPAGTYEPWSEPAGDDDLGPTDVEPTPGADRP